MTWEGAIEQAVDATGHDRYRWLCSDANPDVIQRDAYRALVTSLVTGEPLRRSAAQAEPDTSAALRAYLADHPCGPC